MGTEDLLNLADVLHFELGRYMSQIRRTGATDAFTLAERTSLAFLEVNRELKARKAP